MIKFKSAQSGFSLVETLVAITILLIVIVGPMTISTSAARSTSYSSEQVVAFLLAQEGLELAQKARDDLILNNFLPASDLLYVANPWTSFVDSVSGPLSDCYNSAGCGIEIQGASTDVTTAGVCTGSVCRLSYDSSRIRDKYNHDSLGTITPYSRSVHFTLDSSGNEVRVESRVRWRSGTQRNFQEVVLETSLFNVYGN